MYVKASSSEATRRLPVRTEWCAQTSAPNRSYTILHMVPACKKPLPHETIEAVSAPFPHRTISPQCGFLMPASPHSNRDRRQEHRSPRPETCMSFSLGTSKNYLMLLRGLAVAVKGGDLPVGSRQACRFHTESSFTSRPENPEANPVRSCVHPGVAASRGCGKKLSMATC